MSPLLALFTEFQTWSRELMNANPDIISIGFSSVGAHLIEVDQNSPTADATIHHLCATVPCIVWIRPAERHQMVER